MVEPLIVSLLPACSTWFALGGFRHCSVVSSCKPSLPSRIGRFPHSDRCSFSLGAATIGGDNRVGRRRFLWVWLAACLAIFASYASANETITYTYDSQGRVT